jgi:RNase adaptor protein for sRNA GlmZ degradation
MMWKTVFQNARFPAILADVKMQTLAAMSATHDVLVVFVCTRGKHRSVALCHVVEAARHNSP